MNGVILVWFSFTVDCVDIDIMSQIYSHYSHSYVCVYVMHRNMKSAINALCGAILLSF